MAAQKWTFLERSAQDDDWHTKYSAAFRAFLSREGVEVIRLPPLARAQALISLALEQLRSAGADSEVVTANAAGVMVKRRTFMQSRLLKSLSMDGNPGVIPSPLAVQLSHSPVV